VSLRVLFVRRFNFTCTRNIHSPIASQHQQVDEEGAGR
jgi:hypothetical protein